MEYLSNFTKLNKDDAAIAGGKGASLSGMQKFGFLVPDGFVVLASTFEKFLEETDLNVEIDAILNSVIHNQISTIEMASERIQALILQAKIPNSIEISIKDSFKSLDAKFVAIRSSATTEDSASAAWAAQQRAQAAVAAATASWFSQRQKGSLEAQRGLSRRMLPPPWPAGAGGHRQ